jgi:hypothetical protein
MTDVLIRNVPDDDLRRIDAEAVRRGLTRNELLRRELAKLGARDGRLTLDDFHKFDGLGDDDLMRDAWS